MIGLLRLMSALDSETRRDRLRGWLQRHDHELAERAVADIEENDALHNAAKHAVSATQLRGLQNTATVCSLPDLTEYIGKRQERRKDTDEGEAAFWEALLRAIGDLEPLSETAAQDCGAEETTPQSVRESRLDERTVKTQVARRYLSHFVAHCQYLQTLDQ
jgi:hypothetical protein